MGTKPVLEHEAPEAVREVYRDIKDTCRTESIPQMFLYLGAYPAFLSHVWPSMKSNITHPSFQTTAKQVEKDIVQSGKMLVSAAPDACIALERIIPAWEDRSRVAVELHDFFSLQCMLSVVTVAVRESAKGWAVGAKYIQSTSAHEGETFTHADVPHDESALASQAFNATESELLVRSAFVGALVPFVLLIHQEFAELIHTDAYVYQRLAVEKALVAQVYNMPEPLHASYRDVANLVPPQELTEIFYLLTEKFPTVYAVASLMWGYGCALLPDTSRP